VSISPSPAPALAPFDSSNNMQPYVRGRATRALGALLGAAAVGATDLYVSDRAR
jgi:hypothetical protein